jgi:hypothetical protein
MAKERYQPLINGKAYTWSQIDVNILGVSVTGITAISYSDSQEMEDNYGAGNRPVSRGYGAKESEGSITLYAEEVEALQDAEETGDIMDIPEFDIVVSYLPEGGVIRQHTLHNCRFKGNGRDTSQGDTSIPVEIELQVSHITWKS